MKGYHPLVIQFLYEVGYRKVKREGKGSHEKWVKENFPTQIVPKNLYSKELANSILKSAGIGKKF